MWCDLSDASKKSLLVWWLTFNWRKCLHIIYERCVYFNDYNIATIALLPSHLKLCIILLPPSHYCYHTCICIVLLIPSHYAQPLFADCIITTITLLPPYLYLHCAINYHHIIILKSISVHYVITTITIFPSYQYLHHVIATITLLPQYMYLYCVIAIIILPS